MNSEIAPVPGEKPPPGRLLVTARGLRRTRKAARALLRAVPDARVLDTGFRGIFVLEVERGDPLELAKHVIRVAGGSIGRVLAVQVEVASDPQRVEAAAVVVARRQVGPSDSFCFRLHKRGVHGMAEESRVLERRIGGAIWEALRERDGTAPRVDLTDADVTVSAELLGPRTVVCVRRRAWRGAQESAPSP